MTVLSGGVILSAPSLFLNHPVLVEGNCLGPGAAERIIVVPGTCGDWDGDGRIGTLEDTDEADRVFGTINAALGPGTGAAAGTGANQNGKVTIVQSGDFPETVIITAANGNVTLEGAPGVEANIDAVVQGVPGGTARQDAPGVIISAPTDRHVVIRNITVRNWTSGIQVLADSRASIETVRLENNTDYGVEVKDDARVTIAKSEVHGTGRRVGSPTPRSPINDFPRVAQPMPGTGIEFSDMSSGTVFFTTVSGSFRAGIANVGRGQVCVSHVNVFDNDPNLRGVSGDGPGNSDHCDDRGRGN
jgi:parallel beta helix pectate lyase-like protein